ncbi:MAG TPA: AAA family ATPase [Candidatus Angelobacter sp.]|jgi:predicted ATPase|nr:AAA family ATPase [Candidatus Angelobacter sp.]
MFIERIRAWNFKNFEELDLELRPFNVLVGANASGKSNTLEILKFIRDVATSGLDNAISLQAGAKYLTNLRAGLGRDFRLEIVTKPATEERVAHMIPRIQAASPDEKTGGQHVAFWQLLAEIDAVRYTLSIHFGHDTGFEVVEDAIEVHADFSRVRMRESHRLGRGTVRFQNLRGKIEVQTSLPGGESARPEDFWFGTGEGRLPPNKTISLELPLSFLMPSEVYQETGFKSIEVFDIDPKSPKFGVRMAGKADLEDDGENLALVLKTILEDEQAKRKLSNLLKDLLPFVGDFAVEPFSDRTFLFKLQEMFFPEEYLPASLLSDGTINVTALIVALYFGRQSLVAFEEPERNLHPSLIGKLMQVLRDGSLKKQVIITTHSPEVVRHANLSDLILVSRNRMGISKLSRPAESGDLKVFLKNEIGIEDLFVNNMLEHSVDAI